MRCSFCEEGGALAGVASAALPTARHGTDRDAGVHGMRAAGGGHGDVGVSSDGAASALRGRREALEPSGLQSVAPPARRWQGPAAPSQPMPQQALGVDPLQIVLPALASLPINLILCRACNVILSVPPKLADAQRIRTVMAKAHLHLNAHRACDCRGAAAGQTSAGPVALQVFGALWHPEALPAYLQVVSQAPRRLNRYSRAATQPQSARELTEQTEAEECDVFWAVFDVVRVTCGVCPGSVNVPIDARESHALTPEHLEAARSLHSISATSEASC